MKQKIWLHWPQTVRPCVKSAWITTDKCSSGSQLTIVPVKIGGHYVFFRKHEFLSFPLRNRMWMYTEFTVICTNMKWAVLKITTEIYTLCWLLQMNYFCNFLLSTKLSKYNNDVPNDRKMLSVFAKTKFLALKEIPYFSLILFST